MSERDEQWIRDVTEAAQVIRARVEEVFGQRRLDVPANLIEPMMSGSDDARKIELTYAGRRWQDMDAMRMNEYACNLYCMSIEAMYYYLPALITGSLELIQSQAGLPMFVILNLTPNPYNSGRPEEMATRVSRQEWKILVSFFEWCQLWLWNNEDVSECLRFWRNATVERPSADGR